MRHCRPRGARRGEPRRAGAGDDRRARTPGTGRHGLAVFDDAVLGNARLSIIDPAGGHQPLYGPDGSTALVCNGEIYGHHRIRERHPDYPFRTGSDCEVALTLYHEHGDGFLPHLPGHLRPGPVGRSTADVAPGAGPIRRATALLRNHRRRAAGVRIGVPGAARRRFRRRGPGPGDGRRDAPPGLRPVGPIDLVRCPGRAPRVTAASCDPGTAPQGRAMVDRPGGRARPRRRRSGASWLRHELDRAVQDQLEADVPLGAFLSGGIDSTTIAALAARHHPDLHAFTFDMPGDSELRFAEETAAMHGMTLHVVPTRHERRGRSSSQICRPRGTSRSVTPRRFRRGF